MTAAPVTASSTLELITRFENAFNARDIDAIMADMTEDCIFEHVAPAAVSFGRHEGQAAVRAVWESLETHFPGYSFEFHDIFGAGDRGACRWTLRWPEADGEAEMHGADVFELRDGKIAVKYSYGTA